MRALVAILAAGLAAGQTQDPPPAPAPTPSAQLLARIRAHMAETLEHQPDYTCLETVERTYRTAGSRKPHLDDTLRLEVALVGGREMFAWPGEKTFEETDLRKMIPSGTFGNGNFALHERSVFLGRVASFDYRGQEIVEGASGPLERYDFHVPRALSGYTIRVGDRSGVAGFHGSFWAEKPTLDVRRLEVIAEEIPADLGVTAASDRVDYARVPIGTGEFLLPVASELRMSDAYGIDNENHVRFSACRQYHGESTLRFDDGASAAASTAAPPPPPPAETDLPAGLSFSVALDQDLDIDSAAVGDPVKLQLTSDLRRKGEVLARKGAAASGRITRLDRTAGATVLGVALVTLNDAPATPARVYRVSAKLDQVVGLPLFAPPHDVRVQTGPAQPGEGLLVLRAGHVRLIRGILMYWGT